jgi:hypothetical protein
MAYSKEYLKQLTALHNKSSFGSGGEIPLIIKEILDNGKVKSFLDFGSGKGYLSQAISEAYPNIKLYTYDPVTSPIELPSRVDLTYSSDVLEHVEPNLLEQTLDDLFDRTTMYQYHLIACHPAKKKLDDGRNAHLIIEDPDWWKQKLKKYNWSVEYENITERYIEKFNINAIKYITVLKK